MEEASDSLSVKERRTLLPSSLSGHLRNDSLQVCTESLLQKSGSLCKSMKPISLQQSLEVRFSPHKTCDSRSLEMMKPCPECNTGAIMVEAPLLMAKGKATEWTWECP